MPINGFATYSLHGGEGRNYARYAHENGARLIDTASAHEKAEKNGNSDCAEKKFNNENRRHSFPAVPPIFIWLRY